MEELAPRFDSSELRQLAVELGKTHSDRLEQQNKSNSQEKRSATKTTGASLGLPDGEQKSRPKEKATREEGAES